MRAPEFVRHSSAARRQPGVPSGLVRTRLKDGVRVLNPRRFFAVVAHEFEQLRAGANQPQSASLQQLQLTFDARTQLYFGGAVLAPRA